MSNTICSAKFLHASLTSKEHGETQGGLYASLPKGVSWFLRNWKAHSALEAMDSNLKNPWHMLLDAATPVQLQDYLQC